MIDYDKIDFISFEQKNSYFISKISKNQSFCQLFLSLGNGNGYVNMFIWDHLRECNVIQRQCDLCTEFEFSGFLSSDSE